MKINGTSERILPHCIVCRPHCVLLMHLGTLGSPKCLVFNGGFKDVLTQSYPNNPHQMK